MMGNFNGQSVEFFIIAAGINFTTVGVNLAQSFAGNL